MKTALITGSTKGIGRQVGIDLLDKDYFVYFNGHTQESTKQLKKELYKYKNYYIIEADVSDKSYNHILFTLKRKNIDVLVLNAGLTDRTPFGKVKEEAWDIVFNTNLKIPFFLVQALKDKIKLNGRIIFISSISGCTTDSTSISYGVSKGAIHVLVPYLAKEFASKRITVNAIAPGYTNTMWHQNKSPEQIKRIEKKCLANRLGTTQEISKAVMSIIDNDYINAQVIKVDGGFLV